MAYTITVDQSAIVDTQVNSAASANTPLANLKTAVLDLGNAVSAPEQFRLAQIATPSNPAASSDKLYFKSDDILYRLTSAGVETVVGPYTLPTQAMTTLTARTVITTATSVTTPAIAGTYKHLLFVLEARTDAAGAGDSILMRFNGDTGSNYDYQFMNGSATAVTAAESLAAAYILLPFAAIGNTGSSGNGIAYVNIMNYTSTTMVRACAMECGARTGTTTGLLKDARGKGWWRNAAAAITSISIYPLVGTNIVTNSAYTVYGYN